MKKITLGFVICLFLCVVGCQQQQSEILVLTNVTVIDGSGTPPQTGVSVVITEDRIVAVSHVDKIDIPRKARVVDSSGKYIIPGLWDMHAHFYAGGADLAPLFIANGVTCVRDIGGDFVQLQKMRSQIKDGTLIGSRIKTPGPLLESAKWITMVEKLLHNLFSPNESAWKSLKRPRKK